LDYSKGIGVVKDEAQAAEWYRKAVEQENAQDDFLEED
jgi:TPR repeat protein